MQVAKEHIENAMRLIQDSESLRAALSDAQNLDTGIGVLMQAFKGLGMEMDEASLKAFLKEPFQSRELGDEQLESVTGGSVISDVIGMQCSFVRDVMNI